MIQIETFTANGTYNYIFKVHIRTNISKQSEIERRSRKTNREKYFKRSFHQNADKTSYRVTHLQQSISLQAIAVCHSIFK